MAKENQHYIPQGYLRGFTCAGEKSLIWEYDKEGTQPPRRQSIRKVCSAPLYYAQYDEKGAIDKERLENAFHVVEQKVPIIIRSISPVPGQKVQLSAEQRTVLGFFICLLLTRVPSFRRGIEELHKKALECALENLVGAQEEDGKLPAPIKELVTKDAIKIHVKPQVSLKPMVDVATSGLRSLCEKVWNFVIPGDGMTFVTSDNPVHFRLPEKYLPPGNQPTIGPFHPLSDITVPLRKDLGLICSPVVDLTFVQANALDRVCTKLDRRDTKNINRRIAFSARRYVYSTEESDPLARMVMKLKGTGQGITIH